ncbi:hypothetical protein F5148DRAFT_1284260 [Russula earlei]|uniref:Uncharacterized protein n=1 Tax=Russula earlei TaxID=71964 RepID=A0ACC0U9L9_9AGAM|nr:hypothetical protein F5148DRAFT_1284260 [Russula earlei]
MEPPTPSTPTSDSHPSIPVSHPRSSPRSLPSSSPPQPPISPPRSSGVTTTTTQLTSFGSPVANVSDGPAPPTPPATLSHSVPSVQVDSDPPGVPAATKADPSELRIPNVYINGLPPNFPEEQLYALTKDFGAVVSVRTFTRHVSDRPSGYGFVLFEKIEGAEKCIEALRRYRNLHPSFCKNFHPIPGTCYASLTSSGTQLSQPPSSGADCDSFKARMERLKDETSTNLYIEGLPLRIDETILASLVAPHVIKSSRFFQTRLSHPPRTIAFVRLETRAACDEIIKRLHGRMVKGWDDPGSRISVRFADSPEQRELRRSERSDRGDDSSPARLTMAQAALLNLRGQQIQGHLRVPQQSPHPSQQRRLLSVQPSVGVHDFPGEHQRPTGSRLPSHPLVSQGHAELENTHDPLTTSHSAPAHLYGRNELATSGLPTALGSDIDLSTLSRTAGANGLTPLEQQLILQSRLQAEIDARQRAFYASQSNNSLSGGAIQTTSLLPDQDEELSQSLNNLSLRSAHVAKEFVPRGSVIRLQQPHTYGSTLSSRLSADLLPSEVADDHHASKPHNTQSLSFTSYQQQQQQHGNASVINSRALGLASKDSSLKNNNSPILVGEKDCSTRPSNSLDVVSDGSHRRASIQRQEQQNLAVHMRSTTLPSHFTVSGSNSTHNTGTLSLRLNGILSPNLPAGSGVGNRGQIGKLNVGVPSGELPINRQIDTLSSDGKLIHPHNSVADSPFLIPSPALTYNSSSSASSRTPSTLSPSTPFFGSFPHPGDSYGAYNEEHGGKTDAEMAHDVNAFDIGTKIRSGSG